MPWADLDFGFEVQIFDTVASPFMPRSSPFVYLEAAADDAYRLLQEFEFGRLDGRIIAAGRLHTAEQMWQDLGDPNGGSDTRNVWGIQIH